MRRSFITSNKPRLLLMKSSFLQLAAVLITGALLVAGCGKNSTSSSAGSSDNSAENSTTNYPLPDPPVVVNCTPGVRGGKFIICELREPKTFNYLISDELSSRYIGRFMFWGLLAFDVPTQTVRPALAESWTNSPDGKTWTFKLRKNLHWSDGQPITADDVVFTWNNLIYNPDIPNPVRDQFILDGKKFAVTKVDDLTVQVVTPEVYAPFLQSFGANIPIYPKHNLLRYANAGFPSAYGVNWDPGDIVCDGPYCLKEYKQAEYALLERNPYFFEVDSNGTRLPYFDELVFSIVPDYNAQDLRFLGGEADVDDFIYPSQYDQFKAASAGGKFDFLDPGIGLVTTFFWFNENTNINTHTGKPYVDPVKLKWFTNDKFRQAISYAIDRDAIIRSVENGRGVPQYGFLTSGYQNWYDANAKTYPYDPAKALELLKEIGIEKRNGDDFLTDADGNKIEFVFNTNVENNERNKMAVLIVSDLQKIGVHVIFQPIEFNTLITKIDDTFDYDCVMLGNYSDGGTDPFNFMDIIKSSAYDHYWFAREKSPVTPWEARLDQLMDAQMNTLDLSQREKDVNEVQEILADEQPMIFTVTPEYYAAIRPDVGNVRATALSWFQLTWNAEEFYFTKHQ
jgi:peptide/nickel transport system substrate-binding protein